MEGSLVPPCLELGEGPKHRLLTFMTRKTGRQGLVLMSEDRLHYQSGADEDSFQYLEDADYIERVTCGESFRYRVLVFCLCGGGNPPGFPAAGGREPMLGAKRRMGDPTGLAVGVIPGAFAFNGVKSESVQNPVSLLARDFFPTVLPENIRPQCKFEAMARNLKTWKPKYGISIETLRLMMEEFGRHPEWYHRSRTPVWRVFLARRDQLVTLVTSQQARDPAARVNSRNYTGPGSYWDCHTPRTYSPA
jgi:hypothetical protein